MTSSAGVAEPSSGGDAELAELLQFLYTAPVGLIDFADDGAIGLINPAAVRLLLPYAPSADFDCLFDAVPTLAAPLRQTISRDARIGLLGQALRAVSPRPPAPGGATRTVVSLQLFRSRPGRLMAVVWDDTLTLEMEERRVTFASRHDALTGLCNREGLVAVLRDDPHDAAALLAINLDRFGKVNDAFGSGVGDQVLTIVAERLRSALRGPAPAHGDAAAAGSLLARLGADSFAVLIRGVREVGDARAVCQRLLRVVAEPMSADGRRLKITASAGVRPCSPRDEDADRLLQDAEFALLEAKRAGGARCVVFAASQREAAARRGLLEADLRFAIERGELFVVYQPVLHLADRRVDSVEALVRWRHPQRGVVAPGEFIDVAEASGLIAPLGEFVLDEACAALRRLRRRFGADAPRSVAVNASRSQLAEAGFAGRVLAVLARHGLQPRALHVEVTETQAAQDALVQQTLAELRGAGVTLALDDFGTGYSSLASLQALPVDTLKIDRSFVARIEDSEHHRVLVQATLMVARSLGLSTVAEGVETEGQLAILGSLGCDHAQGYRMAAPMEEQALAGWIAAHAAAPATG